MNGADKFIAKICKKFIIILLIMGNYKQSIFLSTTSNIWSRYVSEWVITEVSKLMLHWKFSTTIRNGNEVA